MSQQRPQPGERFLHFKNKLYQILAVATHSETGEELVIYQALYGDFGVYARPLAMFTGEVDHEKYPEVTQKYRFLLIEPESEQPRNAQLQQEQQTPVQEVPQDIQQLLMAFYDAQSYHEKYNILKQMKDDLTDVMIDNMAVVMDVVIPEGDLEMRYEELKNCIKTYEKYETSRLR